MVVSVGVSEAVSAVLVWVGVGMVPVEVGVAVSFVAGFFTNVGVVENSGVTVGVDDGV